MFEMTAVKISYPQL